jgi:serine/threonine protein kinase
VDGGMTSLDSLQGWWENPFAQNGVNMQLVRGKNVYINNSRIPESLKIGPGKKLTLGKYSGVVKGGGREISWDSGKIVWTFIGELPDMYDPDTKEGRFVYTSLLGKGAYGVVCRAIDMHVAKDEWQVQVAVKVLRSSSEVSPQELSDSALRMHCEFLWSHLLLHNTKHKYYNREQGRLFLQYYEDHTGLPLASEEQLRAPNLFQKMKASTRIAQLPYVVMELAQGNGSWEALFEQPDASSRLTAHEKRQILHQLASSLNYLGKFDLLHRDLQFHNMFLRRSNGQVHVTIGDFGMMSKRAQSVIFAPSDVESWKMRDWIPWEAWNTNTSSKPMPARGKVRCLSPAEIQQRQGVDVSWQAFDVFSVGVIHLYLCLGQLETRRILEHLRLDLKHSPLNDESSKRLVVAPDLAIRMVSKDPSARPPVSEVLASVAKLGPIRSMLSWLARPCSSRRARSRSRSPKRLR